MEHTPFVERRACPPECPHSEKIAVVYEKVVTGNGELPLAEKVRKLEDEMSMALPILQRLEMAAVRQDGRDAERLAAEKRREKAWETFRRNLTLAIILLGLLVAAATYWKQVHETLLKIPELRMPDVSGKVYALLHEHPQDAGIALNP